MSTTRGRRKSGRKTTSGAEKPVRCFTSQELLIVSRREPERCAQWTGDPHVPERGHGEYLQTTVLRMNIFVGDIIYRFSARVNECEVEKRRGG
jgi:hypothetical protein